MRQIVRFLSFLLILIHVLVVWGASHHPQDFLKKIAGFQDEGEQIVQHYCSSCHAVKPIIPLGAPRIGQTTDWEPRLKEGFDALLKHTDEGLNAMPPRGGCFECSDQQIILAILAMLPEKLRTDLVREQKDYK